MQASPDQRAEPAASRSAPGVLPPAAARAARGAMAGGYRQELHREAVVMVNTGRFRTSGMSDQSSAKPIPNCMQSPASGDRSSVRLQTHAATPPGPKTGPQICTLRCAKQYFAEQNSRRDPLARCGVHAFRMPEASMLPPGRPRREKTRLSRLFDFCNDIAEISRWNRFQRNESADPERRILVGGIQPSGRLTLSQTVTGRATGPPIRTRWPAPRNAPPTYRRVPPSAIPCRAPCAQGSSRS